MPTIKPGSAAIQHYYRALQEAEQQQWLDEGGEESERLIHISTLMILLLNIQLI